MDVGVYLLEASMKVGVKAPGNENDIPEIVKDTILDYHSVDSFII
jgi:hypothetical protein